MTACAWSTHSLYCCILADIESSHQVALLSYIVRKMLVHKWTRLLATLMLFGHALAMFSKRQGPDRDISDKAKKFKANIDDLFLSNDISATRAQSVYQDGADCDLPGWKKAAKVGSHGSSTKHINRDLIRLLTRGCLWPAFFYAPVRVWDVKTQQVILVQLPFLLPHDLLYVLANRADNLDGFYCTDGLCQQSKRHLDKVSAELQTRLIAIGLWGDGTPCNFDRTQSMESFCLNLPGLTGDLGNLRIPITGLNKKFMAKGKTEDDIMEVIAWSFRCLLTGVMPEYDLHGAKLKGKAAKWAGQPVPKAILTEVRADWSWLKATFRFPQHNELDGICWQCDAKPEDIKKCTSDARWKTNRCGHFDMVHRLLEKGLTLSPLLGCPYFRTTCFLVDWLHCADIGVLCDFLAALFLLLLPKLPGTNQTQQVASLWQCMQQFYKQNITDSKLDQLKYSMLKQPKKFPKLRARAAEARGLVPFGLNMANTFLSDNVEHEKTAKLAMMHLHLCYTMLSPTVFCPEIMKANSIKFCLLYVALEEYDPVMFHIMPKLHMFQELTQMSRSCPSLFWTYRDEEFGGTVAQLSKRRGGSNNPKSTAESFLNKFRAKHDDLPRI